jgi:hypothetical protein
VPLEMAGRPNGEPQRIAEAGSQAAGRPLARDALATLPWRAVAEWPDGAALVYRTGDSQPVPVVGPGLPVTVLPTEAGPVLVGWDEEHGVVHRSTSPETVPVTGRLTSVRAAVGEDVTVLSEVLIARARVVDSRATSTDVEVHLLPGLALSDDSEFAVAAGAGDLAVKVGRFRILERAGATQGSSGTVQGRIEWDAQGLAALQRTGAAPALVWLAVGRSLRTVGPVNLDRGRVLSLDVGGRWVLAPSAVGRAMLVPGRGLRIRAAQFVHRMNRKARGV